ncbi:response regulator transcription factor [Serratia marcescens]|uniref:Helix-turn-helix transcriptional regulator n=2 Tax=Serratia marcescens TaxID=615 RepID=A0ABD6HKP3_SERMA|nr:LuxR C-terminal-related transcriptional regulator [Serratia marcescens]MVF02473.1 helix-turn-helix transcriptional regulator [Serratia marcescens]PNU34403.1 helix-turn-helix transcriptional regulator [Serratia marcescens]PNU50031.1 helix-turn-helix transcriptional regulator [Serratia marcescens]
MLSIGIVSENIFFREAIKRILMPRIFHKDHVIAYYDDLPLAMGRNCHDILIVDDAVKSMLRFSMAVALLAAIHGVKIFLTTEEKRHLLFRSVSHDVVVLDKKGSVPGISKELSFLMDNISQRPALNGGVASGVGRHTKSCLTESEVETLHLLSFGYTVTQVSRILDKSVKTVSTQKCSALRKMGLKNRVHNLLEISSGFSEVP